MIRIFAALNGAIFHDERNWSPAYTKILFSAFRTCRDRFRTAS